MAFNEDTRVKIPCILHLVRWGYSYLSLKNAVWDEKTNIFEDIFRASMKRVNPSLSDAEIQNLLVETKLTLENEDLGAAFYEKLIATSGARLLDFTDFSNNTFHVVTELSYINDDEEFRPDITVLVNGLPLAFIEVKKPHNREGILAERERIIRRCANPRFRRFINLTQLMIFSNNMEYDSAESASRHPVAGAFYATMSYGAPVFNYFREEDTALLTSPPLLPPCDAIENTILQDTNHVPIKYSPEFIQNKHPESPTHRLCTSLLSQERLAFLLRYAIAYVKSSDGAAKHIMRYPQIFATKAIERALDAGTRKGIIWHTQGSGKTALAYYNTRFLRDYFQQRGIVPKFYFVVDRLDLLTQAQQEFLSRGLVVHTVDSREAFAKDIKSPKAVHSDSGKAEITVVNIQKFQDDAHVVRVEDYNTSIQRIYFLDEVHRSYNPKGSFLANLTQSDVNAIKIGLTGTPLLGDETSSRHIFGDYIHKYYYNASIADGYTLRLIREDIASNYKIVMQKAMQELEVRQGTLDKKVIYSHKNFVSPMLDYVLDDFSKSRIAHNDNNIGAMVICDSAEQARMFYEVFQAYKADNIDRTDTAIQSAALILHDVGTKEDRRAWVDAFKDGHIDMLIVFNMLLTGFDAPRLKKLYLGRVIKKHNLLQCLTRVNRPHGNFRYGYIVDFADIRKEFDATNEAYFKELQDELGDEMESYSKLFKSQEEIIQEINEIKDALFHFDIENAENFSQQISLIQDPEQVRTLKKVLANARDLYNCLRTQGAVAFLQDMDFHKLNILYREVSNHLDMLNLKARLESADHTENLLNLALEDVIFTFSKIGEEELILADKLKDILRRTREAFARHFDQQDPHFITLREELERLFKKKKLSEVEQEAMTVNIDALTQIFERINELFRKDVLLNGKYDGDAKFTRIHKRLMESEDFIASDRTVYDALMAIKTAADSSVLQSMQLLNNEQYFSKTMQPVVIKALRDALQDHTLLTAHSVQHVNRLVVREYMGEYTGN